MIIGDCVRLKSGTGPMMCLSKDEPITSGYQINEVQCCYWHEFKEEFVNVSLNRDMLMLVESQVESQGAQDSE